MRVTVDTLKTHRFPAHGELTMDWQGSFLHTQARGPFNLEMMDQALTLAVTMGLKLWPKGGLEVELFEWHDSMLMPPDAFRLVETRFSEFAAWGRTPRHTLMVVEPHVEGRWLMVPRLTALWSGTRPVEVFEHLTPALARVQQLLEAAKGRRKA